MESATRVKGCIVNVGVNASHGSIRSPLFPNGRFILLPIPERKGFENCPEILTYSDILKDTGSLRKRILPSRHFNTKVHNDPEFETYTYGDYPGSVPKASKLKRLGTGDYIFFLSRLVEFDGEAYGTAGFYIVGYLRIERIFRDIARKPSQQILSSISGNAHVKRGLCCEQYFDRFWVFKGDKGESSVAETAVPFDRHLADRLLRDAKGNKLSWDCAKSDLQVIGSYTRTCPIIGSNDEVDSIRILLDLLLN